MAMDSSLYACQIPAATYSVGDVVQMGCIRGPEVVRAGYGAAILKKIFTLTGTANAIFKIVVKNSNWVDSMSNIGQGVGETSLDENSTSIQRGHDCPLIANSSWNIYAECIVAGTEASASMAFALIDIDYPSVAAVKNPRIEQGIPVTTDSQDMITITADTAAPSAIVWTTKSVDILKAGSRYLIDQVSLRASGIGLVGFVEISGAAGQNGLARIIPCRAGSSAGIKYLIDCATPLVKGPMNIAYAAIGTAGTVTAYSYIDWIKR